MSSTIALPFTFSFLLAVCVGSLWAQEKKDSQSLTFEGDRILNFLTEDSELAKDPVLREIVLEDLKRYEEGELNPVIFSDPVASELQMIDRLKSEGLSTEEAREKARQFHAFREDLATLTLEAGPQERRRMAEQFRKTLEERLAQREEKLKKDRQLRQESIRRRTEERLERQQESGQRER